MANRRILTTAIAAAAILGFFFAFRPDPAPADGKLHLRYWEKWTGSEEDAMRKVVDTFNARQDRIKVEYLAVSEVNKKMILATAGGNPPDVAGLWDTDVPVFADYDALRPLDDLCRESNLGAKDFLPAYWDLCTHRGKVFAMPTTPASVALHWNRKLFKEAGLDPDRPPKTLDELDAMAEKLTKRDATGKIVQTGFLPAEPGWWNWGWGYWFGGKLWDGNERVTVPTPENLRAFNWVKGYVHRYHPKDLSVFQAGFGNFSSPQNAFLSGKVAMVLQGVWMANYINDYNPSMDWDAAPFPYPADRPDLANSTAVGLDVLSIPRGAPHPREAWEFIKFVESQEGMELLCNGQWKHSPLSHVSPEFYKKHRNKRIKLFYDLAAGKNTFRWPKVGIWREWNDEMTAAFQKLWNEDDTKPEDVLQYVQNRVQPKLSQYLEATRARYASK